MVTLPLASTSLPKLVPIVPNWTSWPAVRAMLPLGAVIAVLLTLATMLESKPVAINVTLPELPPPWTTSVPVASLRKMDPRLVKEMSPEVTTSSPSTLALSPPIWTAPKLLTAMPPVPVSASNRPVWVSIALPGTPIPLAALRITDVATMSGAASESPPSVMLPLETRVTAPVVCTFWIAIESGDRAALVRLPMLKFAAPRESVKLTMMCTPAVLTVRFSASVGCSKVKTITPFWSRMAEILSPGTPLSSIV
jgi:hypothetical protein